MNDPSWFDRVLPALAALAGVLVTGSIEWIKTASTRRHETKTLFRDRLETLTAALTETIAWADSLLSASEYDVLRARSVPIPPRRIHALTLVYFPELRPFAERLLTASQNLSNVLISAPRWLPPITAGGNAALHSPDQLQASAESFRQARCDLDDAIAAYARKHVR